MDFKSELEMFSAASIPLIVKLFLEAAADGSGALDLEEFCDGLKRTM